MKEREEGKEKPETSMEKKERWKKKEGKMKEGKKKKRGFVFYVNKCKPLSSATLKTWTMLAIQTL